MTQHLSSPADVEIIRASDVLLAKNRARKCLIQFTFGENDIRLLANKFHLNERAFSVYIIERKIPQNLLLLIHSVNTISISTSECERGFSQMNLIMTSQRASLLVNTVSSLLFMHW